MAWTTIETKNAKYILLFGTHFSERERSPVGFDALIIENNGAYAYDSMNLTDHKNLLKQAIEENKPVWLTDVELSEESERRFFIGNALQAAIGSVGGGVGVVKTSENMLALKKKKITRRQFAKRMAISLGLIMPFGRNVLEGLILQNLSGKIKNEKYWNATTKIDEFVMGKGVLEIRNAITAEKSEKFIAPELAKKLGRKPVIAMNWGAGHYGIRELLLNPAKRREIIRKNNLYEYVKPYYERSRRIIFENSKIKNIEEVMQVIKPKKTGSQANKIGKISRRDFFRRFTPRRHA